MKPKAREYHIADRRRRVGLANTIQAIGGALSAFAAFIAIMVAIGVEKRAHQRFQEQLDRDGEIAQMNLKPLLDVYPTNRQDRKAVTLGNYGLGPAKITARPSYSKDGRVEHEKLSELISFQKEKNKSGQLKQPTRWTSWAFRKDTYFVRPGQEIPLFDFTEKILLAQDFDEKTARRILDNCREQLTNITIDIIYEDILGNRQDPLNYKILPPG
jgi:hypothetical protein